MNVFQRAQGYVHVHYRISEGTRTDRREPVHSCTPEKHWDAVEELEAVAHTCFWKQRAQKQRRKSVKQMHRGIDIHKEKCIGDWIEQNSSLNCSVFTNV